MEPRKYALADLFEGHLVYVVPNYQRLYVWNREDQWEPLWSDVADIADELLQEARTKQSKSVNPEAVESHFLGAVVLKLSGSTPDLARQMRVIDGQQRLTTLQLLLAAAVTSLESKGLLNSADRLKQLMTNSSGSAPSSMYKINHHQHERGYDYKRFGDVLNAALNGQEVASIDGPMADCYRFFQDVILEWLDARQEEINIAASALATTLIMKLHVVGIYLDPHEKEHIIFETLNARGEPLTEWDKIKNYLLYKADKATELDQEAFFHNYLDRFDTKWWRQAVGRGTQRPRTDVFSDYWLESRKGMPVAVRRVFREFQKHVDNESESLDQTMQELVKDAQYFEYFEELRSSATRESLFHNRRRDMAIGAIWPLLLRLQRIEADQTERNRWFSTLESYFVRRMIVGYQARSYDQVALELLNALWATDGYESNIGNKMLEQLLQYSESATLWPSDAELRHAVLNRRLPQYAQRMVLAAVEKHLITNRAAIGDLAPDVQVEHIMPRGWQADSWPLPESIEPTLAREQREGAIETLGNLTLLNGRLNASISNSAWRIKQKEVQKSDNLFLNRRLLEGAGDEWGECDIKARGEWLYDNIVEIWPRG